MNQYINKSDSSLVLRGLSAEQKNTLDFRGGSFVLYAVCLYNYYTVLLTNKHFSKVSFFFVYYSMRDE